MLGCRDRRGSFDAIARFWGELDGSDSGFEHEDQLITPEFFSRLVRAEGVEPSSHAWEARIIPIYYAREKIAVDKTRPPARRNPELRGNLPNRRIFSNGASERRIRRCH